MPSRARRPGRRCGVDRLSAWTSRPLDLKAPPGAAQVLPPQMISQPRYHDVILPYWLCVPSEASRVDSGRGQRRSEIDPFPTAGSIVGTGSVSGDRRQRFSQVRQPDWW